MKLVIAITGASGAIYAHQLLSFLKNEGGHEVALMASPNGQRILKEEINTTIKDYGFNTFAHTDFNCPFASGSAMADAMVVVPCSMGSMARIATGLASDLISRSADVFLKEKRKLILVPRETPLSLIHIKNMETLSLAGATLIPANPSYYSEPKTIEDVAATVTSRILDHLGIPNNLMKRWKL
ncbi:UbiX family flavin prenyltransferase [bacterium]|nr:UbiX family flavin prenyltransferase [bacterium]